MSRYFDELLKEHRTVAVLRNMTPSRALTVAGQAWDLGISTVEVTVETPAAIETLEVVVAAGRRRGKDVGAGTVLTRDQLNAAAQAGARFVVSPGLNLPMIGWARQLDLPYLPGVMTPTEVQAGLSEGLTYMKVFPANVLGPSWVSTLAGPFPAVKFVATGGIDAHNAAAYLDAGAYAVGVGSALEDANQLPLLAALTPRTPRIT